MANVAPGNILEGGGADFMGKELKAELCVAGAPLAVVGASMKSSNKYGDFCGFTIVVGGQGPHRGEQYLIALKHNDVRERQAKAFLGLLSDANVTSVGPVFLSQIETKGGNVAWILQNSPHEGPLLNMGDGDGASDSGDATASPTGVSVADDDIPF